MHWLKNGLTESTISTPKLQQWVARLSKFASHRAVPIAFVLIAILRNLFLLLAYPPAQASDSDLFFLYAERLAGYDVPLLDNVTYPLYPFLILVTYKWMGSAFWLIALQFIMSALIAPLYYFALRAYSPILAMLVGIVLLTDVQVGVTFNLTGAEPLYIFLLAVLFLFLLPPMATRIQRRVTWRDVMPGILMMLLWLTRSIGRYLMLPYALVYGFYTRSWRRALAMLVGFGVSWLLYSLLSTLVLGQVAGLTATDYAFARVMRHHEDWVLPENGENSRLWLEMVDDCQPPTQFHQAYCLYEQTGDWGQAEQIIQRTAIETLFPNLEAYMVEVWEGVTFMLSANIAPLYTADEFVPSQAQCPFADERADGLTADYVQTDVNRVTGVVLPYSGAEYDAKLIEFRETMRGVYLALCPIYDHQPAIREGVDWLMELNRSFGRPNPHIWYGGLLLSVILIPWARRYQPFVFIMGGTMLMLVVSPAALSEAVYTNLRYVLPINALRISLLVTLGFILIKLFVLLVDRWFSRNQNQEPNL